MSIINMQLKPLRSKDIVFQSMPPETILLNLETGYYFSTNRLGALIWEICDGKTEIAAMIEQLHKQFDVPIEDLTEDINDFITQLIEEELLQENHHV